MKTFEIIKYKIRGKKPWTHGYSYYKENVIKDILTNKDLLDCFLNSKSLSPRYGYRLDERVVEYPWFFSRIGRDRKLLLDAGSALNHRYILNLPILNNKSIVVYNLSQERVVKCKNVSYIYGDLRNAVFKDGYFDEIVCISTLEHIGMDNTFIYSKDSRFKESKTNDYKNAVKEFKRLLKPGGKLFITIPYGRYENHGWLQQFDENMVAGVVDMFEGSMSNVSYYKYFPDGWQIASRQSCRDASYFDINKRRDYESDYVAAARAVACMELAK